MMASAAQFHSPSSLQDMLLDYVGRNLYYDRKGKKGIFWKQFLHREAFLPICLSDSLFSRMSRQMLIDRETLALFKPGTCPLRTVHIHKGDLLKEELRILKGHKLTQLVITENTKVPVNDIIGCLGEWSLANIVAFNVSGGTFCDPSKLHISVSLSKLERLRVLDVSETEFNDNDLMIVTQDLPLLESLNLSRTPVCNLNHLLYRKKTLKSLTLFDLRAPQGSEAVDVIRNLIHLEHLDISDDVRLAIELYSEIQKQTIDANYLLSFHDAWPKLRSLDISGKDKLDLHDLQKFVHKHPQLSFLGLSCVPTHISGDDMFANEKDSQFRPNLKISGEATERQVLVSLTTHQERCAYLQKALCCLFDLTQSFTQPKLELIKPVIHLLKKYKSEMSIQMAGTACAYNMCKKDMGLLLHPYYLYEIAECCLDTMANFPHHQQLQKNVLLTMCNDRILQDVSFNRFRCARLVMDCLCNYNDTHMQRMCVAICGIIASKIPTAQTGQLGKEVRYMQVLLRIVREKLASEQDDLTLRFTLSALWNLTDESEETCNVFFEYGGLKLFQSMLELYNRKLDEGSPHIQTKLLGLLNNVAEIPKLRKQLMSPELLVLISDLLRHGELDTSYFAGGIFSHLLNDPNCDWLKSGQDKGSLLKCLGDNIMQWHTPDGEMVAYRSFRPFFPLMRSRYTQVQLWATWAIHYVVSKNGPRYSDMLVDEGGLFLIQRLLMNKNTCKDTMKLVYRIKEVLAKQLGEIKLEVLMMQFGHYVSMGDRQSVSMCT